MRTRFRLSWVLYVEIYNKAELWIIEKSPLNASSGRTI